MNHRITTFSPCAVFTALTLTICVNAATTTITTTMTPAQKGAEVSKESRDVDVIDMISVMNECNETFRTEMSYVESLNKSGGFPDENEKTAKCFVRCLLEKTGVISEDGVFDTERAPAFFAAEWSTITQEDFRDSTDACSNRNETCNCERSYQFVKCVAEMELNKYDILKTVF